MVKVLRLVLAFGFAACAGYCAYAYATMPYELVTSTSTVTRAVPDGGGVIFLAIVLAGFAVVAAFSGDWD